MPTFHTDWFTANIPVWEKYVRPRLEKHPARFLEVGSFEGRSACWLLQNALTDPRDRLTCVDPFETYGALDGGGAVSGYYEYEAIFDQNMCEIAAGSRLKKIKGLSQEVLRTLPLGSYDGCYIDGSHYTRDVLRDAVLAFDLIRVGGFILFDDYPYAPAQDQVVRDAIDAFLSIYQQDINVVLRAAGWAQPQVLVERTR
jgi:predicted O-methyltransferase YrrM